MALLLTPSLWLAAAYSDLPLFGRHFDDGIYLSSAKGIADGQGYRIMNLPGEPLQVKYPPLLPLVMATGWKAGATFTEARQIASWLAWLPFPLLLTVCWIYMRSLPIGWSIYGILIAFSFNFVLLLSSRTVMADVWGLTLFVAVLAAAARNRSWLAGLAAGAACMTRTAYLPIVGVMILWLLWTKRIRQAILFTLFAAPPLVWWYLRRLGVSLPKADTFAYAYSEYGDHLQPSRFLENLPDVFTAIGWLFISGGSGWWSVYASAVLTVGGIAAVTRLWGVTTVVRPYVVFGAIYTAIVLCWRFEPTPRALLPVLPLLLIGIGYEAERLQRLAKASWIKGDRTGPILVSLVAFCLFSCMVYAGFHGFLVKMPHDFETSRIVRQRQAPFFAWARANLAQARVVSAYDGLLYLETGCQGARIPDHLQVREGDPRSAPQILKEWSEYSMRNGYTHIVFTDADTQLESDPSTLAAVEVHASKQPFLENVYRSSSASCYRFVAPARAMLETSLTKQQRQPD